MTKIASDAEDVFIICETVAAITTHLRRVGAIQPSFSGHRDRPRTLCGMEAAWDTQLPISAMRCRKCKDALASLEVSLGKAEANRKRLLGTK